MRKLAVIRDNESKPCPFGLPIPIACLKVGNSILKMDLLKADLNHSDKIAAANQEIFLWDSEGKKCPFAEKFLNSHVNCIYEEKDNHDGIVGSPIYIKPFSGSVMNGLYTEPAAYYSQGPLESGPFYNMYSIETVSSEEISNKK